MSAEGKRILITGSTDGIGKITAEKLAEQKAHVIIHGRDATKTQQVRDEIQDKTGNYNVHLCIADFSSLNNVRRMADEIDSQFEGLDVLINNAGLGFGNKRQESEDGYELLFAVNYLSHFLLTNLLLSLLTQAAPTRIVNVSSGAQNPINFDDVMLEENYDSHRAYGQSKLALIMFTFELSERLHEDNISANTLHPGTYLNTKMVRNAGIKPLGEASKGEEAIIRLAISEQFEKESGKYFDVKKEAKAHSMAYDDRARQRLWEISEELTGLKG